MAGVFMIFLLFISLGMCATMSIDKFNIEKLNARREKLSKRLEKNTIEKKPTLQSTDLGEIANIVGATLLKDTGLSHSPMIQMLPSVVKMLPNLLSSELGQQVINTALQSKVSEVVGPLLSQVLSPDIDNSKFVSELTGSDRIGSAVKLLEQVAGPSFNNIMTLANQVGSSLLSTTHEVATGSVAVGLGLTVLSYIIQYVGTLFGSEINLINTIRGEIGALDAPDFSINLGNALNKYN